MLIKAIKLQMWTWQAIKGKSVNLEILMCKPIQINQRVRDRHSIESAIVSLYCYVILTRTFLFGLISPSRYRVKLNTHKSIGTYLLVAAVRLN